jgi:murein DD-endopeptidase MepM/ murein hydrolase activator NlpD
MPFPLPFIPTPSYRRSPNNARYFGASRSNGSRLHAGCDLIGPVNTDIVAVEDGSVVEVSETFYNGTGVIALRHRSGFIARYCEVLPASVRGVCNGAAVQQGAVIAKVGQMQSSAMLHFELYSGSGTGALTQRNSPLRYQRRSDLVDPTAFLDYLTSFIMCCHGAIPRHLFSTSVTS